LVTSTSLPSRNQPYAARTLGVDDHVATVVGIPDRPEASLSVVKAFVPFRQNPTLENQNGVQKIDLMLFNVGLAFGFVPLKVHSGSSPGGDAGGR
jgi:hypothetical protein